MKKFEIINNTWIKKLDLKKTVDTSTHIEIMNAAKISSISRTWAYSFEMFGRIEYHICLMSDCGTSLEFIYEKSQEQEFKNDLIFFENLFFK
jgi:hypothetical protein